MFAFADAPTQTFTFQTNKNSNSLQLWPLTPFVDMYNQKNKRLITPYEAGSTLIPKWFCNLRSRPSWKENASSLQLHKSLYILKEIQCSILFLWLEVKVCLLVSMNSFYQLHGKGCNVFCIARHFCICFTGLSVAQSYLYPLYIDGGQQFKHFT